MKKRNFAQAAMAGLAMAAATCLSFPDRLINRMVIRKINSHKKSGQGRQPEPGQLHTERKGNYNEIIH